MNKHLFLMGMAAAVLMTSCANDDDLAGANNNSTIERDANSDIPVMLSVGQKANLTRAALGNRDEEGNYDGTFDAKGLGIYCLATGKIYGTQDITWKTGFDNPNFLWMENIKADATTAVDPTLGELGEDGQPKGKKVTSLSFYDKTGNKAGEKYYYPMGSQYSYSFYGYYPYNETVNHDQAGEKYSVNITGIDGTKDIIWGKSVVPADDKHADEAFSAKYFRSHKADDIEAGTEYNYKNYLPNVTFKHKLMKLNIILQKGNGGNTRIEHLGIKSVKLLNVADAGTLVIANLKTDAAASTDKEGSFNVDWTTANNHNTEATALSLCDYKGDVIDNSTIVLGAKDTVSYGDGFLIPVPTKNQDGSYVDNGYLNTENEQLANKGVFRLRVDYFMDDDNPQVVYKSAQYEVYPSFKNHADEAWQEGYEYDIVISVSDPEEIKANATLTPWEKRIIELE